MFDGKEGIVELEIWICDPDRVVKEGVSGLLIPGCGYVMFQMPSRVEIEQCPACDNEYQFVQIKNLMAVIEISEVVEDKPQLSAVPVKRPRRPIKKVSPKP